MTLLQLWMHARTRTQTHTQTHTDGLEALARLSHICLPIVTSTKGVERTANRLRASMSSLISFAT